MTLSRRSFLKVLAVIPVVAMFLPKKVPTIPEPEIKKFGTKSSRFDGKGIYGDDEGEIGVLTND